MNVLGPSSLSMLTVLGSPENAPQDETLQYLLILGSKALLNTLVLSFWRRRILRSLLGVCSISMFVMDLLLVCAVCSAWLLREQFSTSVSMCFILSHASTLYALLPVPILLAGALDYASYPQLDSSRCSPQRVLKYWTVVVLLWALASIFAAFYTDSAALQMQQEMLRHSAALEMHQETRNVTVCRVHESSVVSRFSLCLLIAVVLVLVVHLRMLPAWLRRAQELSRQQEWLDSGSPEVLPPLGVSLSLGFAISWTPFLLVALSCMVLGLVVPAYASVNLLWVACTNSLLVGVAFWIRSPRIGPFVSLPDDACDWKIYWRLSYRAPASVDAKLQKEPHQAQKV